MGRQSEAFLTGEGDAWYERNKEKAQADPVLKAMADLGIKPKSALEIGCGTGQRLKALHEAHRTLCIGIDASRSAIDIAKRYAPIKAAHGTIISVPVVGSFDAVIFGFCLYVCDPEELMTIAAKADLAVKNGGHLIIHDFLPDAPCSRDYKHKAGLMSRKMDHAKLWLAHPAYTMLHREIVDVSEGVAVTVLKKDMEIAFPEEQ